jgi:hypothetical protein
MQKKMAINVSFLDRFQKLELYKVCPKHSIKIVSKILEIRSVDFGPQFFILVQFSLFKPFRTKIFGFFLSNIEHDFYRNKKTN